MGAKATIHDPQANRFAIWRGLNARNMRIIIGTTQSLCQSRNAGRLKMHLADIPPEVDMYESRKIKQFRNYIVVGIVSFVAGWLLRTVFR